MSRKKKSDTATAPMFDIKTTTVPCVLAIRDKVHQWRAADYPGATDTSRRLLHFWFHTDHRLAGGRRFKVDSSKPATDIVSVVDVSITRPPSCPFSGPRGYARCPSG
jgi:hypothetical protein